MAMNKSTFLTGVVSTVLLFIAVLMKSLHWPGTGLILTVAVAAFAFGYSILLFLDKNKGAQNGTDKLANVMAMLTMIIVSVSFLFKAMHWPGA